MAIASLILTAEYERLGDIWVATTGLVLALRVGAACRLSPAVVACTQPPLAGFAPANYTTQLESIWRTDCIKEV